MWGRGRPAPHAHAAGRCAGGFENRGTLNQTEEGNDPQMCHGEKRATIGNKLGKIPFPQISLIFWRVSHGVRPALDIPPGSSKAGRPGRIRTLISKCPQENGQCPAARLSQRACLRNRKGGVREQSPGFTPAPPRGAAFTHRHRTPRSRPSCRSAWASCGLCVNLSSGTSNPHALM